MADTAVPAVDPAQTALVLIEYQNDFTSPGGTLHGAVAPVMESTGMLQNTVDLVAKARAAGATIVHTPISFAPGYGEISSNPYGILAGVVEAMQGVVALATNEFFVVTQKWVFQLDVTTWGWIHILIGLIGAATGVALLYARRKDSERAGFELLVFTDP